MEFPDGRLISTKSVDNSVEKFGAAMAVHGNFATFTCLPKY